ncbi:MAG TPA: hypothetical protein VJT74_14375, partial [Pyrinomonadaceae bacterium]|nr:hypothetical protein [Pyrinomonadaceae bacterium]
AALSLVFVSAQARAQMDDELKNKLLGAFNNSAEELDRGDDVVIRGHRTGDGKFLSCEGKTYEVGTASVRESGPCQQSGGTHRIGILMGEIVALDVDKRILGLKIEGRAEPYILYLPRGVKFLRGRELHDANDAAVGGLMHTTVGVFSILGRADAITTEVSALPLGVNELKQ